MNRIADHYLPYWIFLTAVCWSVAGLSPHDGIAQNSERCDRTVARGQELYVEGRFDEVIGILTPCANRDDVLIADAVAALRLIALSHLRRGDVGEARTAVVRLVGRLPEYQADPIQDIPSYVALVNLVREQLQLDAGVPLIADEAPPPDAPRRSWLRSNRGWLLGGGSLALAGIVAVLVGGGGGNIGPAALPPPPAMPD